MPTSFNSTFAARLANRQDAPLYAVQVSGYSRVFTTGPVQSASWTYSELLSDVRVEAARIDPSTGGFTLAGLSFVLTEDRNGGHVRDLLSTDEASPAVPSLAGRQVTLWVGFRSMSQTYWEDIGTFAIDGVEMVGVGQYRFDCVDNLYQLDRGLFESFGDPVETRSVDSNTTDDVGTNATATKLWVQSIDGLETGDDLVILHASSKERIWTNASSVGYATNASGRNIAVIYLPAAPGFTIPEDSRVYKAWRIEGHPVNILMRLLLDDFKTTGAVQTTYPVDAVEGNFTTGDGVGIAASLFNHTQITAERDTYGTGTYGRLIVTGRVDSARALLASYLTGLGTLWLARDGLIKFRGSQLPAPAVGSTPPDVNTSEGWSWSWSRDLSSVINSATIRGNALPGEQPTILTATNQGSITDIGRRDMAVTIPWVDRVKTSAATVASMAGRLFGRVARGRQEIGVVLPLTRLGLEPGDLCTVTHPGLPDTATGGAMSGVSVEVISAGLDARGGSCPVTFWRYAGIRTGLIANDTQTSYSGASASEKLTYAFASNDSGFMPDNTPGYVWL